MNLVPQKLLQQWERDAFNQGIAARDLPDYLRTRENMWRENMYKKPKSKTFLERLADMEPVARVLYINRAKYLELQDIKNKKSDIFLQKRENWWSHLRNAMQNLRISKETLAAHGLDWAECRNFYFSAV